MCLLLCAFHEFAKFLEQVTNWEEKENAHFITGIGFLINVFRSSSCICANK